jgi:hypothetical protein
MRGGALFFTHLFASEEFHGFENRWRGKFNVKNTICKIAHN